MYINNCDRVYLVCYSTETMRYTANVVFATRELAEKKCLEFRDEDGLNWYVIESMLITKMWK